MELQVYEPIIQRETLLVASLGGIIHTFLVTLVNETFPLLPLLQVPIISFGFSVFGFFLGGGVTMFLYLFSPV